MRLKPVQLNKPSKARDVWAYIDSGSVEVYWTVVTPAGTATRSMKLMKSEVRKLAAFCKRRKGE